MRNANSKKLFFMHIVAKLYTNRCVSICCSYIRTGLRVCVCVSTFCMNETRLNVTQCLCGRGERRFNIKFL